MGCPALLYAREAADRILAGRATERIALRLVDEVALVVATFGLAVRGEHFRHQRHDPGIVAGLELLAAVVAAIGQHRELLRSERLARLLGHLLEVVPVRA